MSSVADGLRAVGLPGPDPPRRPIARSRDGWLLTLATLGTDGKPTWHGLWVVRQSTQVLGPRPTRSLATEAAGLSGAAADLSDLVQAAALSYLDVLEEIGERIDAAEARPEPPPIPELSGLLRDLAGVRKHVVRLAVTMGWLEGPLGAEFPGLAGHLGTFATEVDHLEQLSNGLAQAARDLVGLRTAVESNRLAEGANELGRVSNRIAALANTSNLRMLGVAYIALLLALISAVVLIPNTAATILGMPSAAWVPGLWVDLVLVVLAIVPLAVVFSRPWVRRMLHGWRTYESRSAEGLADLPEVPAQTVNSGPAAERLIREGP